jgi:probable rRNA maturation factor
VSIAWKHDALRGGVRLLRRVAEHAVRLAGFSTGSLSIAIVGAATMARLHRRHMGIAGPTDVLTFDLDSDPRAKRIDGEVVVCAAVARATATQLRRSRRPASAAVLAELALYVVHGVLHLAGYDDHSAAAARRMHAREDALLTELGLGPVYNAPTAARPKRRMDATPRRSRP